MLYCYYYYSLDYTLNTAASPTRQLAADVHAIVQHHFSYRDSRSWDIETHVMAPSLTC